MSEQNRRDIVKSLTIGGAAVTTAWTSPVVKSVLTPAHAATTGPDTITPEPSNPDPTTLDPTNSDPTTLDNSDPTTPETTCAGSVRASTDGSIRLRASIVGDCGSPSLTVQIDATNVTDLPSSFQTSPDGDNCEYSIEWTGQTIDVGNTVTVTTDNGDDVCMYTTTVEQPGPQQ